MRLSRLAILVTLGACAEVLQTEEAAPSLSRFSSNQATLLTFEFDGELYVPSAPWSVTSTINDQLLYTIGHLNGDRAVGRLDALTLSNISTSYEDDMVRVRYHAVLPVGWGSKSNLPTSYTLTLPRRADHAGLVAFTESYKTRCVDTGAHDVDETSYWYYYRPKASSTCKLAEADVIRAQVSITVSTENTTGKYPEYHKVWEDDALRVVAIFGKYEDDATSSSDAGIAAYNTFVRETRSLLGSGYVTVPANVPSSPGVSFPDITFDKTLADGRQVSITALLVDNVRTAPASFTTRYEDLSGAADLIFYNGHAGLGANVRALAQKGRFVPGQYQIFFMNGCDTFAYVDGSLAATRARLNPDDVLGTKYMDIVTNVMPAYFSSMSGASLALIRALNNPAQPKTYDQIFTSVDRSQVVVVTGEEDNVFYPGYAPDDDDERVELTDKGVVARNDVKSYETPVVPAGTYTIAITHDPQAPGGDADLYVRVGAAPTTTAYDCRPYLGGSTEMCEVTLSAPNKIFAEVRGFAASSAYLFTLRGEDVGGPAPWSGLHETGFVARNEELGYETPVVPAGTYTFTLAHDPAHPGGDADLYVKVGAAPAPTSFDCRPYKSGSEEVCTMTLSAPAKLFVRVRGFASQVSWFVLTGR